MTADRFEQDLRAVLREGAPDGAPLALRLRLAEVAAHAPASRTWRVAPLSRLAWVLLAAALLVTLLAATVFVGARRPDRAVVIAPSPSLVPAACPPGSTPDEPGPVDQARPPADGLGPMVWNGAAGRMVLLATESWADYARRGDTIYGKRGQVTWTFDVCANRWHKGRLVTAFPQYAPGTLVYDEDSDATLLVAWDAVWSYDIDTDIWTRRGDGPPDRDPGSAFYDPVTGLVLVRGGPTAAIKTYDVDTDRWEQVSQGGSVPPPQGVSGFEFASYDRSADRLVVYRDTGTWLFDPRARTWAEVPWSYPMPPISFFIGFDGMVYDAASEQTLIYGQGSVAAFDARTMKWQYLYGTGSFDYSGAVPVGTGGDSRFDRGLGWAIAYDPVNERVVVAGGTLWSTELNGWQPVDDVVAFDPRTRSWTELLAPSQAQATGQ